MAINNFIKNITSRDLNLSRNTIRTLIKTKNSEALEELFSKSEFIFPFLVERIIKDFVNIVEKEDLETIFEFSKKYCPIFEDLIVLSLRKFACEDLTDDILNLFENGTTEQKIYCAKYFYYINDSLALEYLKKEAYSENYDLKTAVAKTLNKFQDEEVLSDMIELSKKSTDELEKQKYLDFISAYGSKSAIEFIIQEMKFSLMKSVLISALLDNNEIEKLEKLLSFEQLSDILFEIIEAIPEDITLENLCYWNIFALVKTLEKNKNQFINNIFFLLKEKLEEYLKNDVYSFDLDKNYKQELKNLLEYLSKKEYSLSQEEELKKYSSKPQNYILSLEIIKILKEEKYCDFVLNLINENKLNNAILALSVELLKEFKKTNLIKKEVILNLENENLKALILSYM